MGKILDHPWTNRAFLAVAVAVMWFRLAAHDTQLAEIKGTVEHCRTSSEATFQIVTRLDTKLTERIQRADVEHSEFKEHFSKLDSQIMDLYAHKKDRERGFSAGSS